MIKTYYWNTKPNFGDKLGGLLLERFARIKSEWSPAAESDLVLCGSILEKLPENYNGVIAGIGKLHEKTTLKFPCAKILGVRGHLTARGMGIKGNFVVGDPGLLADELVPVEDKEFDLGLIPHWTDKVLETKYKQFKPKIIRVADDPLKVISEIGRCKRIVSSSLHGIILADAFGIPRKIELAPRMISHAHQEGGLFKFEDYSSSLGVKLAIGTMQQIDRNRVIEKQHEIYDMFNELKSIFNAINK